MPFKYAALTEKNLPDQTGKVFIVTGGNSGVGRELVQILYSRHAKIYVASRSESKAMTAINETKQKYTSSTGELHFLYVDLNDLGSVKAAAALFLGKERKLNVLWNNAGVMIPPQGSLTAQKYELQLGTNNVAPFLFTKLLTPLLLETAKTSHAGAVRVVWVASSAADRFPPEGGVDMSNLDYKNDKGAWYKYGVSKAGNILHAKEYAKRYGSGGILSFVSLVWLGYSVTMFDAEIIQGCRSRQSKDRSLQAHASLAAADRKSRPCRPYLRCIQ